MASCFIGIVAANSYTLSSRQPGGLIPAATLRYTLSGLWLQTAINVKICIKFWERGVVCANPRVIHRNCEARILLLEGNGNDLKR